MKWNWVSVRAGSGARQEGVDLKEVFNPVLHNNA